MCWRCLGSPLHQREQIPARIAEEGRPLLGARLAELAGIVAMDHGRLLHESDAAYRALRLDRFGFSGKAERRLPPFPLLMNSSIEEIAIGKLAELRRLAAAVFGG